MLKETGEPIGCMGYYPYGESNIGIGENDAELGYWIAKPYWNQGICTEALRAMIDYCFDKKGFQTLWSDFFVDNPASGRSWKSAASATRAPSTGAATSTGATNAR